jgi:glycosyltransferase involved in cell wall biosynthesis
MRVLHVIHDFLPRHRAGSEIYAYELANAQLRSGDEVHVLCAEYDPERPHGALEWRWLDDLPVTELVNNWRFGTFEETYASTDITRRLEAALDAIQPDILHIHNLLNLSFELPALARRMGIPSVATLHEFVLVCPSGGQRVHLAEEHVCHDLDVERCARCFGESPFHSQMAFARLGGDRVAVAAGVAAGLRRRFPRLFAHLGQRVAERAAEGPDAAAIERRLEAVQTVYEAVDLFVAPSPALGRDFVRFGLPEDKLEVSDYGFVPLAVAKRIPRKDRLRIGFVGTLVWHKGAHVLIDAVAQLPPEAVELHIHGDLNTFPDYTARLREAAEGLPVTFHGGFDRERVAEVYAGFDVLAICSLWPENSPLVIHEAFMAGVPVVGSRMGGTADLVEHEVSGLLYDAFSAEDLAGCLRRLAEDGELCDRLAAAAPKVKTIEDDAKDWDARYRRILAKVLTER